MTTGLKISPRIVGWLANSLLALVFVLIPQSAHADDPIMGAFGLLLGQAFDPPETSRINLDRNVLLFSYLAPAQTPELNELLVMATPVTFRIWGIAASGKSEGLRPCHDRAASEFSMISMKYGGDQYGASLHEYDDGRGWSLTQSKTGRTIRVICNEKGELTRTYLDDTLRQAAQVEHRELNQINTDFEAGEYEKILPRVRELAGLGNVWAETMLGRMYRKGAGVVQDDETAEDYYQRAAQRGWVNAQYNLGLLYFSQFRYKQAEPWLLKAANRERTEAQETLVDLYLAKSPLRSEEKAFTWSLRLAEHGRADAQYYTCLDYANGVGVSRDSQGFSTEHHRNRYLIALGMTSRWYTARMGTKKETKNKQTKSKSTAGKKVAADEEGD
jgi:TPR repeat protein